MENTSALKSINELKDTNFLVEHYQRGYKWTSNEVKQLLDDINEFEGQGFYCLQPVVVKKANEKVELIDGQQRITTIYLILSYLEESQFFSIKYKTRESSRKFLEKIDNIKKLGSNKNLLNWEDYLKSEWEDYLKSEHALDNIDNFHFFQAYLTIKNWFENKNNDRKHFREKLTEKVKVIWYEVPQSAQTENAKKESIEIFTRINSGKIPLTNAELIKALFLVNVDSGKNDELLQLKQNEIAQQWDAIEYTLQDDAFWYFLSNEPPPPTRIELIFDLIRNKPKNNEERLFTFLEYNKSYSEAKDKSKWVSEEWKNVRNAFQTLQEWYENRELYHFIGYLISSNDEKEIKELFDTIQNQKLAKSAFKSNIAERIKKTLYNINIENLEYGKHNEQIKKVLLLHNVIKTMRSKSSRFEFEKMKSEKKKGGNWSLEHIHAQNSDEINKYEDFKLWFEQIPTQTLTDADGIIKQKQELDLKHSNNKEIAQEEIRRLIADIGRLFGDEEDTDHSIKNLALITRNQNSKLNNGIFHVKRDRIISLEKKDAFIPMATRFIFQKYFEGCSKQIMKWEEHDKEAYMKDIKDTLRDYLPNT